LKASSAGKKKCTQNVSVVIPEVKDEEQLETVITVDEDDVARVHSSGIRCPVDSSVTSEV